MKCKAVSLMSLTAVLLAGVAGADSVWLEIPPDTLVCGVFRAGRSCAQEYAFQLMVHFIPGALELPTDQPEFTREIIEAIEFGPQREMADPEERGALFTRQLSGGTRIYGFVQYFRLADYRLRLELNNLYYAAGHKVWVMDQGFIHNRLYLYGQLVPWGGGETEYLALASCTYEQLPLWHIQVQLEGQRHLTLHQRFAPPMVGSGPANLVGAGCVFPDGVQSVTDYWQLVYSADHHNWNERFWVLFDPPLGKDIYGVGVYEHLWSPRSPQAPTYTAELLDADLKPLQSLRVIEYNKFQVTVTPTPAMSPPSPLPTNTHANTPTHTLPLPPPPTYTPTTTPTFTELNPTWTATPPPEHTATVQPTSTWVCRLGDANGDLFVNGADFRAVRDYFGMAGGGPGDANCDLFVNGEDYRCVRDYFGASYQ